MKKVFFIFLIFCYSLIIISCAKKSSNDDDTTAPVIAEVTFVTTLSNDSTPNYTFSSTEAGTITYGGSCSSFTTSAISGNNTITFTSLTDGTYADCTILVKDSSGNVSNTLTLTSFSIETRAPTVSSFYPIDNQTILISDNISVIFSESMDSTSVTTNTSNTSCSGTFQLSSDNFSSCVLISSAPSISNSNKTFSIDPSDNLSLQNTYRIRVTIGVMDSFGNTMSSDNSTATGFIVDSSQNVTLQGRSDGKGVDLIVTGDGFKVGELDDFRTAAQNYIDYMFAYDDNISNHKNAWNVHRLDAISETDCIDGVNNSSHTCATESAFGAYYWCGGTERLLCINTSTVTSKVSAVFPQYDNVIILVNSTKYGGAGYGNGFGTASLHSASNNVALHEMGHSFAGLADEYDYGISSGVAPTSEPSQPNVTINNDNETVKWKIWMDSQNAVLCGQNSLSCIGLFEGGKYVETGVWRPVYNSIMKTLNKPFYVVNMEAWTMAVYQALETTHYSKTPSSSIVSHAPGSTLSYSIELAIDNSSQQVDWYVDNTSILNNSTSFTCCDNKTDNYTVTANIWDWTGAIRKDNSTSSSTINWSVNLQ